MKTCHACGAEWTEKHEPGRGENCLECGADMYCCLNCRLYDPMKSGSCSSRTTDPPSDKAAANSCEEFLMADRPAGTVPPPQARREELKKKWDGLFRD